MDTNIFFTGTSALRYWRWRRRYNSFTEFTPSSAIRLTTDRPALAATMDRLRLIWGADGLRAVFGDPVHILIGSGHALIRSDKLVVHSDARPLPAGSFVELSDGIYVESPALVYTRMARKLSFPRLVALGMELCGTYAMPPTSAEAPSKQSGSGRQPTPSRAKCDVNPILTPVGLRSYLDLLEAAVGSCVRGSSIGIARQAAKRVCASSGSPMETALYELACFPYSHGGYCLPTPLLNAMLDGAGGQTLDRTRCVYKPDLLWPEGKLVLEYFGDDEHTGKEAADLNRVRRLNGLGFTVRILKAADLVNAATFDAYMREVAGSQGKRLRLPADFPARRKQLLGEVMFDG